MSSHRPFRKPLLLTVVAVFAGAGWLLWSTTSTRAGSKADMQVPEAASFARDWKNFQQPSEEALRKELSPLQYKVTQEDGTERPFQNEYWDNKSEGLYVDIISGEPLFSSLHKFKSGTGWPSFTQPLQEEHLTRKVDNKLWAERTEVRSKLADSHLGHVFDDGPPPTGLRYCINSASLRFVPVKNLEAEGYGEYLPAFQEAGVAPKRPTALRE